MSFLIIALCALVAIPATAVLAMLACVLAEAWQELSNEHKAAIVTIWIAITIALMCIVRSLT